MDDSKNYITVIYDNEIIYYDKLSYILAYEAIDIEKNINNNIQEHFITHLNQFVNYSFNLQEQKYWIYRAIVFLEDWSSGHYSEINGNPFVGWRAGDCLVWRYDTPHMAANLGDLPRYTLQITGHK